jgi:small subunit ribosomal protein S7
MAKKYRSTERFLKPDPRHHDLLASKFVNCLMVKGKKSVAQGVFYRAMDLINERVEDKEPVEVFERAVENVKPLVEVRSRRVGGQTYQVPREVPVKRQRSLAIRWIITAARSRKGKPMHVRLADELLAAYRKEGAAMTTRENVHRMAEANKALAHFSW